MRSVRRKLRNMAGVRIPLSASLVNGIFRPNLKLLTVLHNPVTFLRTKSLISFPVELGPPITGSPANLLDENNDEAVLS